MWFYSDWHVYKSTNEKGGWNLLHYSTGTCLSFLEGKYAIFTIACSLLCGEFSFYISAYCYLLLHTFFDKKSGSNNNLK